MLNFKELRDQWALKSEIPQSTIDMHQKSDQMANPHNDSYPNKRRRRSVAEIVADCSYNFADEVLTQIYGNQYSKWLRENTDDPNNKTQARQYKANFKEYSSAV